MSSSPPSASFATSKTLQLPRNPESSTTNSQSAGQNANQFYDPGVFFNPLHHFNSSINGQQAISNDLRIKMLNQIYETTTMLCAQRNLPSTGMPSFANKHFHLMPKSPVALYWSNFMQNLNAVLNEFER